jgi:vacuolar-type H+-ATPase subunit I/STV1
LSIFLNFIHKARYCFLYIYICFTDLIFSRFFTFQMSLGIFLSCLNYVHEKQPMKSINIFFQFIPQIIFLWSIFGYMCVLIIVKWCTDWGLGPCMYFFHHFSLPFPFLFFFLYFPLKSIFVCIPPIIFPGQSLGAVSSPSDARIGVLVLFPPYFSFTFFLFFIFFSNFFYHS